MSRPTDIQNDPGAPFSQEAEEAVLGSVLLNPSAFVSIRAFLKPDDFFLLRHQYIWQALDRINTRNEPIDHITLAEELDHMETLDQIGGRAYLIQLMNNTGTAMHAEVYGRLVERASIRRKLMQAADDIRDLAMNEELNIENVISESEAKLFTVGESQIQREFVPMWDALSDYYDRIEYLLQHQDEAVGLPSGFRDLDQLLGGFQKSDLLVFAGRPGMGKCVDSDTLIHTTENGTMPIGSLKPDNVPGQADDEGGVYYPLEIDVLTPDGIQTTSHFYDAGQKPTRTLTTRAGYTLTGTYNHPVLTLNKHGEKVWVALADISAGDYVATYDETYSEQTRLAESKSGAVVDSVPAQIITPADILPALYQWDAVETIEDSGMRHCCDLVVPESHSYIANGIVSHNTSWMLTTAMNTARLGARVAIFTMEMGVEQMVQRFMAMETGINVQKLRLGDLTPQEAARFTEAVGRISNFRIFIDDTPAMSPMEMRTKCRRLKHEHGLDLLFIDYMQLMNAGGHYENNRVQEISYISRALKELARELNIPVISAAQLSRAVEQRQDKRPVLSDLRESGCLTGDSRVYLPDEGYSVPIRDLMTRDNVQVLSINTETWQIEPATVTNAFCTGTKPVYKMTTALGRSIRATGNHKFLTIEGWKRLDELSSNEHIAIPRQLDGQYEQTMSDAEIALLGHLIGDGCVLPRHAIQYTTVEKELAETVAELANAVFGDSVKPRIHKEPGHNWYQTFIPATRHLTHGVRNPVSDWGEYKQECLAQVVEYVSGREGNTNRDIIPKWTWRNLVVPAMAEIGMSVRNMQAAISMSYCGTSLYKSNMSRSRAARVAKVVQCDELAKLAESSVYWDKIISIEPDGEEEVFDLTVAKTHNFVANDIFAHNSIEQDSDIVMFLYRDEVYNEATEFPNQADIIVAKHRNGPTGTISLYFEKSLTKFMDASVHRVDLSDLE